MQETNVTPIRPAGQAHASESAAVHQCDQCMVASLCLSRGLAPADRNAFKEVVAGSRIARRNEAISQQGQPLKTLMVVRSGSVKRVMHSPTGEQHLLSFHLPGHVIGFDAMASGTHPAMTVALETSSLCLLPVRALESLCSRNPAIQQRVMQASALCIVEGHERARLLSRRAAEQRIAGFLLLLARHQSARRLNARQFNLPMARQDIANYLCLAFETVSRVLSGLASNHVIEIQNRSLHILDPSRLADIADEPEFAGSAAMPGRAQTA